MDRRKRSRRTVVRLAGAAATAGVLAGCAGPGDLVANDDDEETADPDAWEDVDTIFLGAREENWEGVEPSAVDGEGNPTLLLFEGQEYDVVWENADGQWHNFGIRGEDEEWLVSSDSMREQGETQTVTVEATAEMDEYLCEHHVDTMVGDLEIRSE